MEGGMINTGTMAMMVDAMPVLVYLIARSEKETPRKGPKNEPVVIPIIPFEFLNAENTFFHLLLN